MTDAAGEHTTQDGEASTINFVAFVLSLAHTAAVHFGDVGDPITGERHAPNLQPGSSDSDEQRERREAGAEDRFGVDAEPAFQRGRVHLTEVDRHR